MMERRTPPRSSSFKDSVKGMKNSLSRSLSLGTTKLGLRNADSTHHQAQDEMNVFASDMVSKEFILEKLKEIRHNLQIVKLEVEDLLMSQNHNSFLNVVKALLFSKRQWKYLRFLDTIPTTDFLWWQGVKHVLMREYEDTISDEALYTNVVSVQASIQIMKGDSKSGISDILRDILQDKDVINVSYGGALFGYQDAALPDALLGIIDESTGSLKENLVINVECGWNNDDDEMETIADWSKALKSLHRALRHGTAAAAKPNPQEDDMVSVASARSSRSIPRSSGHSMRNNSRSSRQVRRNTTPRTAPRRSQSTEDLPIVVPGGSAGRTLRSLTIPSKASQGSLNTGDAPRRLPQRSKSLQSQKRTSATTGEDDQDDKKNHQWDDAAAAPSKEAEPRRKLPQRAKSFQPVTRPSRRELDDSSSRSSKSRPAPRMPNRSSSFKAKRSTPEDEQPPAPPIRTAEISPARTSSKRSLPLRSKSLSAAAPRRQLRRTDSDESCPDYDWSAGKRVVSSAA